MIEIIRNMVEINGDKLSLRALRLCEKPCIPNKL